MIPADDPRIQENRRRQQELYGQSLNDRLRAVMDSYAIPQRRLAEVLGISAPMLSQLMSARRVKMGNPRSHARMVALEQRSAPFAPSPVPAPLREQVMTEVAAQELADTAHLRARHATDSDPAATAPSDEDLVAALRQRIGAGELRAAHEALERAGTAPHLHELLARALS